MIEFIRFGFFGIGDVPQISHNPTYPLPPHTSHHPEFLPKGFYLLVYPIRVYPHGYSYSGLDANDSHLQWVRE